MTEQLLVLLSGIVVGHLERAEPGDDATFTYAPDYVSTGKIALSAQLPIQTAAHPAGRVRPFLFGLLPEDPDARSAWASGLGVHVDDAFAILTSMGWDCPGAVQFCREDDLDLFSSTGSDPVPCSDEEIAARLRALTGAEPSWTLSGEHWSLAGQQQKFALTRLDGQWHTAHGSAATTHIIKPGVLTLRHQALVEHLTMAAAAAVGVSTAVSDFVRFEDQWAIVLTRFDRAVDGDQVLRVHQEDFAQACGRMPTNKYETNNGPRLLDMARTVQRSSTYLEDDRRALADFIAINLVAGAPDGHAKNISLIRDDEYTGIAPLYDLATGLAYDRSYVERTVAVSIGSERRVSRIRRRQWDKAARTLHLPPEDLVTRVVQLAAEFPAAFADQAERVGEVPGATEVVERTVPELTAHAATVLSNLS